MVEPDARGDARSIEALRTALRVARQRVSPRTIAAEAGVSHTTVYELLGTEPARDLQPDTVGALWTWLDTRRPIVSDSDTVPVSRETIGYLRGKLETTVAWLGSVEMQMGALGSSVHAVGETLTALRSTLDQATSGVAGLLQSDGFPGPAGGSPKKPRPRISMDELRGRDERTGGEQGAGDAETG